MRTYKNKYNEDSRHLSTFLDEHGWISQGCCKIEKQHKPDFLVEIEERYHLKSREGIYTVIGFDKGISFVTLSCWRWEQLGKKPITVHISDIKCKAGRPGDKKRREKKRQELMELLLIEHLRK